MEAGVQVKVIAPILAHHTKEKLLGLESGDYIVRIKTMNIVQGKTINGSCKTYEKVLLTSLDPNIQNLHSIRRKKLKKSLTFNIQENY